jgi:adenosine deaminase
MAPETNQHNRPDQRPELAELHVHLGQSVEPQILWSIAHEQGIKLPTKSYWDFHNLITLNKAGTVTWEDYHELFHWTELIQSSPIAMERSVYEAVSAAYRVSNITLLELSFNPMYRNRGGERDLDSIILSALRGMERALVEFPNVRAGLILFLDRRLPFEKNEVIVKKAIKYRTRGIIGIDIAGPMAEGFTYDACAPLYRLAQENGLKTTVHTGEDGTAEEMEHVLDVLPLDRINHGFRAYTSPELMKKVRERNLTLCLCPTSNMKVEFIQDTVHLGTVLRTLYDNGIKFCLNTDNPSMLKTSVPKEIEIVRSTGVFSESEITKTIQWAFDATFIPTQPGKNLYL